MNSSAIYQERRDKLLQALPDQSVLLLPSAMPAKRSADVNHPYRPCSNLIYFSGFTETPACLMLVKNKFKKNILFVPKKDPKKELWTGPIYGPEKASQVFEIDLCYPIEAFSKKALEIFKKSKTVFYSFNGNGEWDRKVKELISSLKQQKNITLAIADPTSFILPFRMKKQKSEIKLIKTAVKISCEAHKKVMAMARAGLMERDLHGAFIFEIKKRGADFEAYPGIFASGENACILHYTDNNKSLKKGELMLVDAGAEYQYYASDITRTFPVNKKFKDFQKRIYNLVLYSQEELIKMLKPGVSFQKIQRTLVSILAEGLKEEKVFSAPTKKIIEKKLYKKYFPHSFGHLLGLDVHDLSPPKIQNITLEENFILTIEPGLYFPPKDTDIPDHLKGLGIRIEDDVLITKTGAKVLSSMLPKKVKDLENI